MGYLVAQDGPRMVQLGSDWSLTLELYNDTNGAQVTATAATVAISDGGSELLAAVSATTLGPPASYSLLGTVSTGWSPSDLVKEDWTATIAGVTGLKFEVTTYLCRVVYQPTMTHARLIRRYPDLANMMRSGQTNWTEKIKEAQDQIARDLIKKGRRPQLIFDKWALVDAERYLSLALIYDDLSLSIGDGRYKERAQEQRDLYEVEMSEKINFRYDKYQTGTISSSDQESANVPVMITAGVRRGNFSGYGRPY